MVWCSTLWTGSEAAQSARRRSRRLRAGRSIARSCRPLREALSLRVVLRGDHAIASSASVSWRCVAGPVSLGRSCRWLVSCTAAMGTGMKQCVCQAYCCVPRVSGACPRPRHTRFARARRAARCSRRTARDRSIAESPHAGIIASCLWDDDGALNNRCNQRLHNGPIANMLQAVNKAVAPICPYHSYSAAACYLR